MTAGSAAPRTAIRVEWGRRGERDRSIERTAVQVRRSLDRSIGAGQTLLADLRRPEATASVSGDSRATTRRGAAASPRPAHGNTGRIGALPVLQNGVLADGRRGSTVHHTTPMIIGGVLLVVGILIVAVGNVLGRRGPLFRAEAEPGSYEMPS